MLWQCHKAAQLHNNEVPRRTWGTPRNIIKMYSSQHIDSNIRTANTESTRTDIRTEIITLKNVFKFKILYYPLEEVKLFLYLINLPPLSSSGRSSWDGFHSRRYHIFWEVVGLERGSLNIVSITEELLEWKSSGSGSRKSSLTAVGIRCAEH
jgi:hypothetical protein